MTLTLSSKHIAVRDFILEFQRVHGRKPEWKEIMDRMEIRSTRTLAKYLDRLEQAGALKLEYVAPKAESAIA